MCGGMLRLRVFFLPTIFPLRRPRLFLWWLPTPFKGRQRHYGFANSVDPEGQAHAQQRFDLFRFCLPPGQFGNVLAAQEHALSS